MIDREKVIKALECCDSSVFDCEHCSYGNPLSSMDECHDMLLRDAWELLKEQDEETTFVYDEYTLPTCEKCGFRPFVGYIPTIKWMKERGYMKCPGCGRKVKWE